MKLVIVTGMSGAGKTVALKILEDMGFYCVDNLPIPLVETFADLILNNPKEYHTIALGVDIRSGEELNCLTMIFNRWKKQMIPYQILFLDASDSILIKRFKETRRSHPLALAARIDCGIDQERKALGFLKSQADYILDTSQLLTRELRQALERIFADNKAYGNMYATILSFGFKYGVPVDADLVFDVRFLPNPYYDESLRHLTGNERQVQEFVMKGGVGQAFLSKLEDMLEFLIPYYVLEGKNQLVISIGCTGGKHRSVTIANAVYDRLHQKPDIGLKIEHRDIERDIQRK